MNGGIEPQAGRTGHQRSFASLDAGTPPQVRQICLLVAGTAWVRLARSRRPAPATAQIRCHDDARPSGPDALRTPSRY